MTTIFNLPDNIQDTIDLDELYQKKQQSDLMKLNIYGKLLNRIHNKIKYTSKQRNDNEYCWFLVPEVMIGIPKYDNKSCISHVTSRLIDNGFKVVYTHPNLLFISWKHWVPEYVRTEIKKNTGVDVDGNGNVVEHAKDHIKINDTNKKTYKSIKTYKPDSVIYDESIISMVKKVNN
jgi:hypothetical protein